MSKVNYKLNDIMNSDEFENSFTNFVFDFDLDLLEYCWWLWDHNEFIDESIVDLLNDYFFCDIDYG